MFPGPSRRQFEGRTENVSGKGGQRSLGFSVLLYRGDPKGSRTVGIHRHPMASVSSETSPRSGHSQFSCLSPGFFSVGFYSFLISKSPSSSSPKNVSGTRHGIIKVDSESRRRQNRFATRFFQTEMGFSFYLLLLLPFHPCLSWHFRFRSASSRR